MAPKTGGNLILGVTLQVGDLDDDGCVNLIDVAELLANRGR
jgi:hypothetical protein